MNRALTVAAGLSILVASCGGEEIQNLKNEKPTAAFTAPVTASKGEVIDVDGSASSDIDGKIVTYRWEFGDTATAAGMSAQHIYNSGGTFVITLSVTDNLGDTGLATASIIIDANEAPVAVITAPTTAAEGATVSFDGSASTDDGSIARYDWDFGDGQTGAGVSVDHAYATAGNYEASLTVYDDAGASNTATQTLVIEAGPTGYTGSWRWWLTDESLRTDDCGTFQDSNLNIRVNGSSIAVDEIANGSVVQTYTGTLNGTQWQVSYASPTLGIPQIITATFDSMTAFSGTYSIDTGGILNCTTKPVAGLKL